MSVSPFEARSSIFSLSPRVVVGAGPLCTRTARLPVATCAVPRPVATVFAPAAVAAAALHLPLPFAAAAAAAATVAAACGFVQRQLFHPASDPFAA